MKASHLGDKGTQVLEGPSVGGHGHPMLSCPLINEPLLEVISSMHVLARVVREGVNFQFKKN